MEIKTDEIVGKVEVVTVIRTTANAKYRFNVTKNDDVLTSIGCEVLDDSGISVGSLYYEYGNYRVSSFPDSDNVVNYISDFKAFVDENKGKGVDNVG